MKAQGTEFGFPGPIKMEMVVHTSNPSTCVEMGVMGRRVPRNPGATLAYTVMNKRPQLKQSGGEDGHLVVLLTPRKYCAAHTPMLAQKHGHTKL